MESNIAVLHDPDAASSCAPVLIQVLVPSDIVPATIRPSHVESRKWQDALLAVDSYSRDRGRFAERGKRR
ncbi:hypothetical protein A0H81_09350 [Grifola frondosa]|uniref:Uncharacterized protein n=1 Tax=Grifola frondosa TaxID=5627 RepID=A0A1C7M2T2_GRIFR|nr:hypothetical protein A0H81_09350 [Grifola frondosa]